MNIGEIKTQIQDLGYGSDLDAIQLRAINSFSRRVEGKRRWPWQEETSAALSLAIGATNPTSVPADLLHPDSLRIENGTSYYDLEWERPTEIRRLLHLDRDNGIPEIWTYWNGLFYVYPRADLVYVTTLDYVKDPDDFTDDAETPPSPATYHDIYVFGAAALLAARERDWTSASGFSAEARARIIEMEEELGVKQRQTAREVVRSDFWGDTDRTSRGVPLF